MEYQRFCLLTAILLLSGVLSIRDNSVVNLQTGVDLGSSFAGGITFDSQNNRLFLTGGTYARGFFEPGYELINYESEANSDCFFASVKLPNATESSHPKWNMPTRLGYVKDPEACSTVHYMQNHERVFLGASASGESLGSTDIDGDLLPSRKDVALFGEVISASLDHVFRNRAVIPQHYIFGGHGLYNSEVNYPFAITSAPRPPNVTDEEYNVQEQPIYVASLYSKYTGRWSEDYYDREIDLTNPFIDGNVWGIAVQKLLVNPSNATSPMAIKESGKMHIENEWKNNFETTYFQKLQATDMVFVNDFLLLAGSTYDFGDEFAGDQRDKAALGVQDYDGFLVKLNIETGQVAKAGRKGEIMKLRVQSTPEHDDFVNGICLHPAGADGIVPYVYVVGHRVSNYDLDETLSYNTAEDKFAHQTGGAFIMKVDLFSMETIWEKEIKSDFIQGVDCAVTPDGNNVYVAGNVKNGAFLPGELSHGGADVWLQKRVTEDGEIEWTSQIGSEKDEYLAKGGSLVLDNDSNPIICGNTLGSVGRVRVDGLLKRPDNTTDVFVMTVNPQDGTYPQPSPDEVFQISSHFFIGSTKSRHQMAMSGLALAVVVVFVVLLGTERKWKTVDLWYYSYLSDVFRDHKVVMETERLNGVDNVTRRSKRSQDMDPSETQGSFTEDSASERKADLIFV